MSVLKNSWSSFSRSIAKVYLDGYGHPSEKSKFLVASLLREIFGKKPFRLADFGCGNGHLCELFMRRDLSCEYFGYDFSTSLLEAGRERYVGNSRVHFKEADISDPESEIEKCDIVLYSHVFEILQSPEKSLHAARRVAPLVMIRFFEPPVGAHDIVELRQMEVGDGASVPYLRRQISADYYNLILNKVGCRSVDVHQVDGDKDQVHVLRFD